MLSRIPHHLVYDVSYDMLFNFLTLKVHYLWYNILNITSYYLVFKFGTLALLIVKSSLKQSIKIK